MENNTSVANFFKEAFNVDWEKMDIGETIDVSHFNKEVESYSHEEEKKTFNKILAIVRKPDSKEYIIETNKDRISCSSDHKVAVKTDFNKQDYTYMTASVLKGKSFFVLNSDNNWVKGSCYLTKNIIPILDFMVETNHNYFSENILSHNTIYGNPECVTPDTLINRSEGKMSLENIFKEAGVNWEDMEEDSFVDISGKNLKVLSFNHSTETVESKRILKLVRKRNSLTKRVRRSSIVIDENTLELIESKPMEELFRASAGHKIFDPLYGYTNLDNCRDVSFGVGFDMEDEIEEGSILDSFDSANSISIENTGIVEPILDFEVEDNSNYFANGVLSHNTTPGGMALKYYSSIRLETRKVDNITNKDSIDGMVIRIKSIKNKTAMPFKKREVKLLFGKGFQVEDEYVEIAIEQAIIKKGGPWYTIDEDTKLQGKDAVIEYYRENPSKYKELVNLVNQIMFNPEKKEIKEEPVEENKELEETPTSIELSNVKEIIPEDPPKRRGRPKKEESVVDVNDELLDEEDLELSEETVKVLA